MYFKFGYFNENEDFVGIPKRPDTTDHNLNTFTVDIIKTKLQDDLKLTVIDMLIYDGFPYYKKRAFLESNPRLDDSNKGPELHIVVVCDFKATNPSCRAIFRPNPDAKIFQIMERTLNLLDS
jgi:hypothetical protein